MGLDQSQERIIREMSALGEGVEIYEYLIRQGEALPPMPEEFKTGDNLINDCQSPLWLRCELKDGRLIFSGDSEALITRGILALILRVLNHRKPEEVLKSDLYFLSRTGLGSLLSPSRANGLTAIVKRLRRQARETLSRVAAAPEQPAGNREREVTRPDPD